MNEAAKIGDALVPNHGLAVDLIKIAASGEFSEPREIPGFSVREVIVDELDLTSAGSGLSGISFTDCLFSTLYLPDSTSADDLLPRFANCEIEHVEGRAGLDQLSPTMFKECKLGTFSAMLMTNAAVMDARDLEPGIKALVTVLRKLFLQKGAGRKQNAFYRGIGGNSGITSRTIDKVLEAVSSADFAKPTKRATVDRVWYPNRRLAARAKLIVTNPKTSKESIVTIVRSID